ncbi:MAG: aldehyde dehydrogenase family protein [Alphaproteobacteria bacterium]|nr:aldehyde dehydrogenase family protein [Alphaproteobacteria bacterium]
MSSIANLIDSMDYGPAPESADIVETWLDAHKQGFGLYINGKMQPPTEELAEITNPATGKVIAKVSRATSEDVDAAVAAARAAFPKWSSLPGHERARYMYALARHIQQHARFLAVLESMDNGKPIREARDIDVPLVARHFYHHAGWAELMETEFPGAKPLGVCGQVIPWNFPLLMMAWKVAPALAAGNTVVIKPASFTPLSALAFTRICDEVGLPEGVVNVVTGNYQAGQQIVAHPDVNKIAFTGSTPVGQDIRKRTAGSGKKLTLELGGKSPFIVFADADLDAAVEGVVDAIWFNQGQVCCAGSRILVAEGVAERFTALLKARMASLKCGSPLDKCTDIGAIVHPSQKRSIEELVAKGVAQGAELYQGAAMEGCFYPPTLAMNVEPANILATEEIFGPVATLTSFRTPEDAVLLANNTRYGLAASIWSENINLALATAAQVKAGVVWINSTNVFDAGAGFGGYRESGYGREGGREGMLSYLELPGPGPQKNEDDIPAPIRPEPGVGGRLAGIDRTAKFYIGGKQKRPDGNYAYPVIHPKSGKLVGLAGDGNRKDIRDAVEAASNARGWGGSTGHNRAQILYFLAENLAARSDEFADRLQSFGVTAANATREVETSIRRAFWYAAQADKFDGMVHSTQSSFVTLAMYEALGVMGLVCPTAHPLLGLVSLLLPALAMGNCVVAIPSQTWPLSATDLYQVLETSDIPAGVVNIVTGDRESLAKTLADHDGVDGLWYFGSEAGIKRVEESSIGNLKQTWTEPGGRRDWLGKDGYGRSFLYKATQVKNIWVPYGE